MIIQRKYVTLKKLYCTDPYLRAVLDECYAAAGYTAEQKADNLHRQRWTTLFNAPFGFWGGLPDAKRIERSMDRLDREHPYDNGMTLKDVDHAVVLGCKGDTIYLALRDRRQNIVCVLEKTLTQNEPICLDPNSVSLNVQMFPD